MGLGIIGAGSIGAVHADAARRALTPIAGVWDVDFSRAERLAAEHPGAKAAKSLEDLLAMESVTAAVVAVPNHLHHELVIRVLEAGCDVLLEKPMATDLARCDEIMAALERTDRILQLGFVCRFAPVAEAARALIAERALGSIYHAKAHMYRRRGIPGLGRWFTTKSMSGGGVLIDLGVHLVDLVRHLVGADLPLRLSAACAGHFGTPIGRYAYDEMWAGPPDPAGVFDVEDSLTCLMRFPKDLTFELNVTWAANLPEAVIPDGIILLGDKGGMHLDLWENRLTLTHESGGTLTDKVIQPPLDPDDNAWDRAWRSQHEQFQTVVADRAAPRSSAADGRVVQQILEAIYHSSAEGREVTLSES